MAFQDAGKFGTATIRLSTTLSKRPYRVRFATDYVEATGRCTVTGALTNAVSTSCPTSGNVTIADNCTYAPGNYTLGNVTVQEGATVTLKAEVGCGETTCSLASGARKVLLVARHNLTIQGAVQSGESISVVSPDPVIDPVVLVGNDSVTVTGAVVKTE